MRKLLGTIKTYFYKGNYLTEFIYKILLEKKLEISTPLITTFKFAKYIK